MNTAAALPQGLGGLLKAYVWENRRAYGASALMLLGIALLVTWMPRQVGRIVDELVAGRLNRSELWQPLSLLLLAGLSIYGLRVGWRLVLFGASFKLGQRLRVQLFEKLAAQAPSYFQAQRGGDLMALATNDVDAVEQASGEAMLAGFDGTMTFVLVLLAMVVGIDWRLGLAALLPFPFMAWAFWFISEKVHQQWAASLEHFSKMSRQAQQGLSNLRTVRAMGLTGQEQAAFDSWAEASVLASFRAQRWEAAYEPAVGISLTCATVLAMGMGGYLVAQGQLSIGQLTAFTMLMGHLIWPMFAAGWVLSLIERGRAAWTRLAPALQQPNSLVDDGTRSPVRQAALRVRDLHFAYASEAAPVLRGIDINLQPGRVLAVVGPTGAGKTTLLRLLLRQWVPTKGSIELDGEPLADWTREAVSAAMAWVPQEPFLFSASVADNIALARPGASRAEVEHAADTAALHSDVLRLPQGYETVVGEKGVSLSGGQRQRVAIARALLSGAPLLLMDDALSAVDTGTEAQILTHLRELRAKRPETALIVVTHRLSAAVDADEIVVLRHGVITERGCHAELVQQDGWYATQWRYQQLEASLDD